MPPISLAKRLDALEKAVTPLSNVPERVSTVEARILQLRQDTRDDISAIRRDTVTKDDLRSAIAPLATKAELKAAIAPLATRDEMLMLHEDLVARLKVLGEAWSKSRVKKRS